MVEASLQRLCRGLPVRELTSIVEEAKLCEAQLEQEITLLESTLEASLSSDGTPTRSRNLEDQDALNAILESSLTPLHQYWTASSLLGRLKNELALPVLDTTNLSLHHNETASANSSKVACISKEEEALQALVNPIIGGTLSNVYAKQKLSPQTLLAVWKKISSHRAAHVFRRAVKPEEAPGYIERIVFPMDLSLVRKRIVVENITTLEQLHQSMALIAHNCVKYNGRNSDYGRIAVEFEAMADNIILQAVRQQHASNNHTTNCDSGTGQTIATTTTSNGSTFTQRGPERNQPSHHLVVPTNFSTEAATTYGNFDADTAPKQPS